MELNQKRFETKETSTPLALGIWLRALQSYTESSVETTDETSEAFVPKRDYTDDARIVHEVLLRCSQITISLTESESKQVSEDEAATFNTFVSSTHPSESPSELHVEWRDSMTAFWEILRDAVNLIEAMLKTSTINLQGWASFNNVIMRELNNSEVAERLKLVVTADGAERIHPVLLTIVEKLDSEAFGADLYAVFASLTRQLEYLSFIEASLKGGQSIKPLLPVFTLINRESLELLEHIEKRALRYADSEKSVIETLDGTAYAIKMELRKAFEHELSGMRDERHPHYIYAKTENAHGLLRNCFQQSIVSLAQLFEPELQGSKLFGFFQTRLDQSLSLRRELWKVLRAVRRVGEDRSEAKFSNLMELLSDFREHNLRFLMFKDWETFEHFYEEIETASGKPQLAHLLHRFEAYLETLFSQINMRAVLTDHPFDVNESV